MYFMPKLTRRLPVWRNSSPIPFALFNRTAFLAEKVLGNVVSSGVKIMVLAVISAIALVLFKQFATSYGDAVPTVGQATSVVLASLAIVGLSIFGGSIANGLISGAPQLGAGAAVGTGMAVGAMGAAAVAGVGAVASGGVAAVGATAAAARGGAAIAGAATSAYSAGAAGASGGAGSMAAGIGGMGRAVGGNIANAAKGAASRAGSSLKESYAAGGRWAARGMGGGSPAGDGSDGSSSGGGGDPTGSGPAGSGPSGPDGGGSSGPTTGGEPPRWARSMKRRNAAAHAAEAVRHNWLRAYDFTTTSGAVALNDYARLNDPFSRIGHEQVEVDIASVIRASPGSFRVAWTERHYRDGAFVGTERWTAIVSIVLRTPRDADHLRKNPLGIYVSAINWSKELGQ